MLHWVQAKDWAFMWTVLAYTICPLFCTQCPTILIALRINLFPPRSSLYFISLMWHGCAFWKYILKLICLICTLLCPQFGPCRVVCLKLDGFQSGHGLLFLHPGFGKISSYCFGTIIFKSWLWGRSVMRLQWWNMGGGRSQIVRVIHGITV
jgi:hypothetical protein